MYGVNCSQDRAYKLSDQFQIYLSPSTGFWIRSDGVECEVYTYRIYKTGDIIEEIPTDAFPFHFEITLSEASKTYDVPYSTLAEWARTGRLDSRKSGSTWLTMPQAIEKILERSR